MKCFSSYVEITHINILLKTSFYLFIFIYLVIFSSFQKTWTNCKKRRVNCLNLLKFWSQNICSVVNTYIAKIKKTKKFCKFILQISV